MDFSEFVLRYRSSTNSETLQATSTNSKYPKNKISVTRFAALGVPHPQNFHFFGFFDFGEFVLGSYDSTNSNILAMGSTNAENSEKYYGFMKFRVGGAGAMLLNRNIFYLKYVRC